MIKEDKTPLDEKGKQHGYWITYLMNRLWYEGNFIHGEKEGYWMWYDTKGNIKFKEYHIK